MDKTNLCKISISKNRLFNVLNSLENNRVFSKQQHLNKHIIDHYLGQITILKLNTEKRELCKESINEKERLSDLKSMKNNRSLENDSFTKNLTKFLEEVTGRNGQA